MLRKMLAVAAVGVLATATITACDKSNQSSNAGSSSNTGGSGKPRVGVILPDAKSSSRWATYDAKFLKEAFTAADVPADIQNAQGDPANFQRIADRMIDSGVKVLMIANLDSDSGKAVLDEARANKIATIDYDRLTLNGGADYYVSFDNELIGEMQGRGLVNCLGAQKTVNPVVAELNGSPTDSDAAQYKQGYDFVLQPYYDDATYTKGPDQSVPDWDATQAGAIFAQMMTQQPDIKGVLAADDGLANSVIELLRKKGLNGKVPVTGQNATVQGLQNLLTGDQCVTVYKRIKPEAQTAANLAVQLFKGQKPSVPGTLKDPESGAYVPFFSLQPLSIDVTKVKDVVADGFVSKEALCAGKYAKLCQTYGVK